MGAVIYRERLPWGSTPYALGRNVNHDPESRRFVYRAAGDVELVPVRHERHVPVFDQGDLGSCTGNAAVGCLATGPFWRTMEPADAPFWPLDQAAAVRCYSEASAIDPFRGQYPPDDTGSDGLSVAKVLTKSGAISGYRHAFGLDQALTALMSWPFITGTVWKTGMFEPDADGVVRATGSDAGGHEFIGDQYVPAGERFGPRSSPAAVPMVGFTNSWGTSFGHGGRFYMVADEYGELLSRNGDVTVFAPAAVAPPVPDSVDPDVDLADAVRGWAGRPAVCNRKVRDALRVWLEAKGL